MDVDALQRELTSSVAQTDDDGDASEEQLDQVRVDQIS